MSTLSYKSEINKKIRGMKPLKLQNKLTSIKRGVYLGQDKILIYMK